MSAIRSGVETVILPQGLQPRVEMGGVTRERGVGLAADLFESAGVGPRVGVFHDRPAIDNLGDFVNPHT
jgi:hypothetical protein